MSKHSLSGSRTKTHLGHLRKVEEREWWLWGSAAAVTLVLTFGILSLALPGFQQRGENTDSLNLKGWLRGLAALVLLFDIYTLYQQRQLHRIRRNSPSGNVSSY